MRVQSKKTINIILALMVLILIILNVKESYFDKPKETKKVEKELTPKTTNEKSKITSKLSSKQYEDIVRAYLQSKNFAVDGDSSYLDKYIKKGTDFEKNVQLDIKNKKIMKADVVIFKKVDLKENKHIVTANVLQEGKDIEITLEIENDVKIIEEKWK